MAILQDIYKGPYNVLSIPLYKTKTVLFQTMMNYLKIYKQNCYLGAVNEQLQVF